MTAERALVVALALTSTAAAGLATGRGAAPRLGALRWTTIALANLAALPLFALALVRAVELDGGTGVIVAAAAPGGSTGPLLALLGRGEARLAATAFVALTVAGTATALLAAQLLAVAEVTTVATTALVVAATSLLPLAAGALVRARASAVAARWQPRLARLSLGLLLATVALLTIRHGHAARPSAIAVGAVLTVAALAIGGLARTAEAQIAIGQVSAVRNLTLVLLVLAVLDAAPAATMAALAYGLAMYAVTLGAAAWTRSAMKPR